MKRTTQTLLVVFVAVLVAFVLFRNAPVGRLEGLTVPGPDGTFLDNLMPPMDAGFAVKRGGGGAPSGGPLPSFTGKGYVWAARQIRTTTKSWAPITVLRDGGGSTLTTSPGEIYLWINQKNRVVAGGSWAQPRAVQHGGRVATMPGRGAGVVMESSAGAAPAFEGGVGGGGGEEGLDDAEGPAWDPSVLDPERLKTLEPTGPSSGDRAWDVVKAALGQQNTLDWEIPPGGGQGADSEYDEDWALDYEEEDAEYASPPGPRTNKYGAMAVGLDGSMTPFDPYRQVSAAEAQKFNQQNAGPLYGVHYTKSLDFLRSRGVKGDLLVLRLSGDVNLRPIPTPAGVTVLHVDDNGLIQNVQLPGAAYTNHGILLARYRL